MYFLLMREFLTTLLFSFDNPLLIFCIAFLICDAVYLHRTSAEESIQRMQGAVIGQQVVRLSWGRSPTAKQVNF